MHLYRLVVTENLKHFGRLMFNVGRLKFIKQKAVLTLKFKRIPPFVMFVKEITQNVSRWCPLLKPKEVLILVSFVETQVA